MYTGHYLIALDPILEQPKYRTTKLKVFYIILLSLQRLQGLNVNILLRHSLFGGDTSSRSRLNINKTAGCMLANFVKRFSIIPMFVGRISHKLVRAMTFSFLRWRQLVFVQDGIHLDAGIPVSVSTWIWWGWMSRFWDEYWWFCGFVVLWMNGST